MRPWEIARLTDHQILNNYIFPAQRRAEAAKRPGPTALPGDPEEFEAPPDRQGMLSVMIGMLRMSKADAAAEYERQLAAWKARNRARRD